MSSPYVIAEMSGNHDHSLDRAMEIVKAAAKAGCDALKLQTYTADSITIDCDRPEFKISDPQSLWYGETLYSLYSKASTPYEWHKPIFDCCRELGITPFSTPFDPAAVDFLESLDCPIYKISSFENGDIPLLKHVAQTHKPVIMSVGLIGPDEIQEAVTALTDNGCPEISLLKCTSAYPAAPKDFNLLTIQDLKRRFPQCKIGLSDHSIGIGVAITAVALGAEVIEKHFTISRADGGVDSAFSMEPDEMRQLVTECRIAQAAIGKVSYSLSADEQKSRKGRRSIYAIRNIKKGEPFSEANTRSIRPGLGIHPRFLEILFHKNAIRDIACGAPITENDFS